MWNALSAKDANNVSEAAFDRFYTSKKNSGELANADIERIARVKDGKGS
jgi:hypothetical protein